MGNFDPEGMVLSARDAAALSLRQSGRVRLAYSLDGDGRYTVTSPDADWLMETAWSQESARYKALTALIRVSRWCGTPARFPRSGS